MPNYLCTINQMGPANYGPTTNPNVYVNLTDTLGSFTDTWFYAAEGIQSQVIDVGLSAIIHKKHVNITADAPVASDGPYTAIVRMAETQPVAPAAASDLHVNGPISTASPGRSIITFAWTDNSGGEAAFNLTYAGRLSGYPDDLQSIQNMKALTFSFNVLDGYGYNATVNAVNAGGVSPGLTIIGSVPGTPPLPAAPSGLTATVSAKGQSDSLVTLNWTDNSNNETGFTIAFTAVAGVGVTLPSVNVPANTTEYSFSVVNNGTTYSVTVKAYDSAGSLPASGAATFTLPAASVTPVASLAAHVNLSFNQPNTYELDITGFNFENEEIVQLVITWWTQNDGSPGTYIEESQPVAFGGFQYAFSGVNDPLEDPEQKFQIQATGLTSNKKATITA